MGEQRWAVSGQRADLFGRCRALTARRPVLRAGGQAAAAPALTVLVPGTADPYLADPANNSLVEPVADGTVPPSISVRGSETLTVKARGRTSNDPANLGHTPNGGYLISAAYGSQGPISSSISP